MSVEHVKGIISKLAVRSKIPLVNGKIDTSGLSEIDAEFLNLFNKEISLFKRGCKDEISAQALINMCLKLLQNRNCNLAYQKQITINKFIKKCAPLPEYSKYDKELAQVDNMSNNLHDMQIGRPIKKMNRHFKIEKVDNIIAQCG